MKIWLSLFGLYFLLGCSSVFAQFSRILQPACNSVESLGYKGKTLYEQKQYAQSIDYFKRQAAWSNYCIDRQEHLLSNIPVESAAMAMKNVALTHIKLGQPQWARAWLLPFAGTPHSDPYLKKLSIPQQPKLLTGYYMQYSSEGSWNYFQVIRTKNHYQLQYMQHHFYALESRFKALKYFTIRMPASQQNTSFQSGSCQIRLGFEFNSQWGQHIVAKQNSGDGVCVQNDHNLWVDGPYIKVESRP